MSIGDISLARNDRRASVAPNFCEPTRTLMAAAQMVGDGYIAFENAHKNMVTIQAVSQQIPGVIRDLVTVL